MKNNGLFGIIGIVFLTLKLSGVINWSWWWVTAPIWGSFLISALIMIIVFRAATKRIIKGVVEDLFSAFSDID